MKEVKEVLGGAAIGALLTWLFGTGLWLVSNTTYPYSRTVGGAILIGAAFAALITTCAILDRRR